MNFDVNRGLTKPRQRLKKSVGNGDKAMKEETKETISSIVFAIAEGSRRNMINTILGYSGDEYEAKDYMEELAKETDEQLKFRLKDLVEYYLNEEK